MTNSDSESDDDGSMLHVGLEEFAEMIAEEMLKRYGNANDDDDSDDDDDSMPPLEDLPSTAAAKNSATSGEDSDDDDDDDDSMPPLEEISASALASASASASASSSNGTNERKRTSAGSSGGTSSARSGSPAIATSASPSAASSTSTTPFTFTAAPVTESRGALSRRTRPSTTTAREKQKKSQEGAKKQSATSTGSTTPFTFSTTSAPAAESSSSSSTPTPFQFTVPANTNTGSKTSAAPSLDPRLNAAAAAAAASASNNNPFSFTPSPSSTNGTGGRRRRTNKTNKTKGRSTAAGSDSTSAASPPLFGASSKTSSNIGKAKSGGDNVPFRFGPTKAAAATASPTSSATATAASSVSGPPSSGTNADQAERAAAAAVSSSNNGKKKKGPKPKRNQSAFFLYSNQVRASVKEQNPNASFGEVAKIISTQFKALSATDRAKYDKLAAEDKARYQREMAQWEKEDDRKPPTTSSSTSTARVRATFAVGATANVRPHNTQDLAEAAAAARADAARVMEECKVEVGSGGSRRCDCPSCRMSSLATQPGAGDMSQDAPAGDAFSFPLTPPGILFNGGGVPGSDGNARRIVRARRPPNAPDTSTSTTPTSANIVGGLSGEGITPGNSGNRPRRRIIGARRPPRATGTDTTPSNANANSARNVVSLSSASAATSNQGPSRSTANHNATLGSGARNRARGNARRAPRAVILVDDTDEEAKDDDNNNNQNSVDQSENANPNTNAFDALADDSNADDNSDGDSSLFDSDDDPYSPSEDDSDDDSEDFMNNHFNQIMQAAIGNFARRVNRPSPQRPASNIRPDDDDDSAASSDDEDGSVAGGAKCAVCFRRDDPSHKWRRLVTLPCCGTDGKDGERTEKTSSTRFCAACILKLAVTRPDSSSNNGEYHRWEDERDEPPTSRFYNENRQSDTKRFIECPRCRDILIVKLKGLTTKANTELDKESSSGECDCTECRAERRANHPPAKIKTAKSISLHRASFKGKAWYVGRKREMANIMWKAAHLHHSFMPLAALGGDKYKSNVMRLVGWGVLRKVPGKKSTDVFWMDRKDQAELVKLVSPQAKNETEEEAGKECDLFFELAFHMATAAKESLMKYRVDQVVRLVNRFLYLFLYFKRYLPPPPLPLWQELVVTAFNVFNLVLILQFLLILAAYAGLFFGVGFSVCYGLRRGNIRSIWWQAILVGYFAFRFSKAIYNCSYFSWMGFVSPKAWIPIKKIVWG